MPFTLQINPHFSAFEIILILILSAPTLYVMLTGAPFVPTPMPQVDRMLKAANLKPGMKIYDLGSGDGRLVHKASSEYGATAIGYEYSPMVWAWAKLISPFWRSKAKLRYGNMWKQDLRDADVIVCYLLPNSMRRLEKELWPQFKPGMLLISHAFALENHKPWKSLPRLRDENLGPVWIYRIGEAQTQSKDSKNKKLGKKAPAGRSPKAKTLKQAPLAPQTSKGTKQSKPKVAQKPKKAQKKA